jgi:hypothetical protein
VLAGRLFGQWFPFPTYRPRVLGISCSFLSVLQTYGFVKARLDGWMVSVC